MRGHHAVEGGAPWREPLLLRLVLAQDEAHELAHAVSLNQGFNLSCHVDFDSKKSYGGNTAA